MSDTKKFPAIGLLVVFGVGALFSFNKGDDRNFQIAKNLDIFNAIFKELDMFYVDTIDPEKVIKYGIDAMLAQTDPYTEYYPEEDNTLKEMTSGKFGGIGSVIRYYTPRKRVAIIEPSEGSPAAEIGLKAGDIIMEINGKDMAQGDRIPNDLTSYVSDNLRGEPGTTCVLKVERPTSDSTYGCGGAGAGIDFKRRTERRRVGLAGTSAACGGPVNNCQIICRCQCNAKCLCRKTYCHTLHNGCTIHVDGCTQRNGKGRNLLGYTNLLIQCLNRHRKRGIRCGC